MRCRLLHPTPHRAARTLEVEFISDAVHRYRGVRQDVFEDFRQAPSKGAFFNTHIKDAYPWEQVE